MVLHIRADGTGPSALAQAVAQHRSGFCANFDLQAGADFADTMPLHIEAGHACSEFLADDLLPAPPRPYRRQLGAVVAVAIVALCCFALPLVAHEYAKYQQQPVPAPSAAPRVWA
jgi:hypothetical protein